MFQILLGRGGQAAGRRLRTRPSTDGHIPYASLYRQGAAWGAGGVGVGSTLYGVYKTFHSMRAFRPYFGL
ncbi:uncharacterized protein ANIA_11624 [Aspergillus nidulans FGSC A4]|uniref:Uncharacterized protein n=1 Tax=Emericella nidulans (strain FGSC A4 / ATCC 38163 / CBS 112.46 / NRRL 194 / M139) TaxID=227321 RepID=C8VAG3_EMENI|nr:hypothetical protein [Aspergillus nidulans FGSC A4]CBF78341.1 TPA: conserved hypothetical protein [Aspergillus nidulans FGSC A4]